MQVAIDGPASAGKSTVAQIIAAKLSYIYIDTGAMYRAATLIARQNNIAFSDETSILAKLAETKIEFQQDEKQQKILIDGVDESLAIRTAEISANVSAVSALAGVRTKMVDLQREMAGSTNVVMDGRDIGTTVLPNAEVKIFLVASAESRAQRRFLDYQQKGIEQDVTVAELKADIEARDYKETKRKISPLQKASDAIEIDTTKMSIDDVVNAIIDIIGKKSNKN